MDECKKQLENVGFVKTILMLIIILGHSFDFWTGTWYSGSVVKTKI